MNTIFGLDFAFLLSGAFLLGVFQRRAAYILFIYIFQENPEIFSFGNELKPTLFLNILPDCFRRCFAY